MKCENLELDEKRKVVKSKSFDLSYESTNLASKNEELVSKIKGILEDNNEIKQYCKQSLTSNKNCEAEASSRIWFASGDWITNIEDTNEPLPFHDTKKEVKNGSMPDVIRAKISSENLVIKKPVQKACSWNTSIADSAGIKLDYRYTSAGLEPSFSNPTSPMIQKAAQLPGNASTECISVSASEGIDAKSSFAINPSTLTTNASNITWNVTEGDLSSENCSEQDQIITPNHSKKLLEPFSRRKPSSCSLEVALKNLKLESAILPSI